MRKMHPDLCDLLLFARQLGRIGKTNDRILSTIALQNLAKKHRSPRGLGLPSQYRSETADTRASSAILLVIRLVGQVWRKDCCNARIECEVVTWVQKGVDGGTGTIVAGNPNNL
jgi:hypothetical protein